MDKVEDKYLVIPTHTKMSLKDALTVSRYIKEIMLSKKS